jgi:hypothetical protein
MNMTFSLDRQRKAVSVALLPVSGIHCVPGALPRSLARWAMVALLGVILANDGSNPALGQTSRYTSKRLENPRSTLGQPFDSPIFLGAYGQLGGTFDFDQGQPGFGAILLFRPGSAVNFLDFLYDWNSSMVLQADYQKVSSDLRILSGDLIIRRYFNDVRVPGTAVSPFVGAGIGASEVTLPPEAGRTFNIDWSWLVEIGQEWEYRTHYLIFIKGQFRHHSSLGYSYAGWTFQAGGGIPLPW